MRKNETVYCNKCKKEIKTHQGIAQEEFLHMDKVGVLESIGVTDGHGLVV